MQREPSRRSFITAVGAAAATSIVGSATARAAPDQAEPAYRSAGELVTALANRQVSSRELVDAAIARIEALDPKINAVVVRDFDRARDAADAADAALGRGERRPLLGLPMTVKEQFNIAGLPTTWGFPKFKDWQPDADALAVQRLKTAGAIILGKTNVPINLADWQSYNAIYGTTNNPWDLTRTPGGSSGGAAAALAAGFVPLELGSDIGGSLRCPADFCGVFSHKPSLDLIPWRGAGPPQTPAIPVRVDLAVIGPMARDARRSRARAVGRCRTGRIDGGDRLQARTAAAAPRQARGFPGAGHRKAPAVPDRSEHQHRARRAGRSTRQNSAAPSSAPVRKCPTWHARRVIIVELLAAFFSADTPPNERLRVEAAAQALSPDDLSLMAAYLRGQTMSHAAWIRTSRIRGGLRAAWQKLFEDVDVVLCPAMPTVAFRHDHSSPSETRQLDVDGNKVPYDNQIAWAGIATSNGLPATTMPIGHDDGGLPIGVQIIGGFLDDRTTIAFAGLVEREFGGFVPPPSL